VLFTPRRYGSLPALPFPGDQDGYPGRDEVIGYLERYASTFELPVQLEARVQSLRPAPGGFVLDLGTHSIGEASRRRDRTVSDPQRARIRRGS
jgi:putative flavoprotein involved in K+ transport